MATFQQISCKVHTVGYIINGIHSQRQCYACVMDKKNNLTLSTVILSNPLMVAERQMNNISFQVWDRPNTYLVISYSYRPNRLSYNLTEVRDFSPSYRIHIHMIT